MPKEEILAVRHYRDRVIIIAREEEQWEETTYEPCAVLAEAQETVTVANIEQAGDSMQSHAAPMVVDYTRQQQTERKVVSAEGFNFGISVTRE